MNFEESLSYLLSLGNEVSAMKLDLENIKILLAALGSPEKKYLKIQIAGTNGKGSTCAFLESICLRAEINIGMTTSPHLVSITERIKIDGEEISEKDFARYATKIREASEMLIETGKLESVPTFFEQVTAIALFAFAESGVELAILETGLGGRFDATTAANAQIVAITPIDYDHQRILGESLAQIAAEKAAIIRADTRVLSTPQKKEAEKVIRGKCREVGVEPIWATSDVKIIEKLIGSLLFVSFKTGAANYKVEMWLPGRHQWTNAALAISIAENLRDYDFKISKDDIELGLETVKHRGRLEFYKNYLFDGAHNIAGAKSLRDFLDEFVEQPVTMVFGAMRDKNLAEIAEILFPKADNLILTKVENERSLTAEELSEFIPDDFDRNKIKLAANVREALAIANENSSVKDLICVTGSLYLIGEAQKILKYQSEI